VHVVCRFPGVVNSMRMLAVAEHSARIEFTILLFVEPGALDVEQPQTRHESGQRQGVDRELGERSVGAGVGLVIEDVHCAVAHLQKIYVSGDRLVGRQVFGAQRNPVLSLQSPDVGRRQPDRHFDGERHRVIREHEALQGLVAAVVIPYRRDNELR